MSVGREKINHPFMGELEPKATSLCSAGFGVFCCCWGFFVVVVFFRKFEKLLDTCLSLLPRAVTFYWETLL